MDLEAMDILNRQESLRLNVPAVASVVGCGGTGFWTALALAMSGCERLLLFDSDTIDHSNLNRLPVDPRSVGMFKVGYLKDMLKRLRPNITVETFRIHVDTTTLDLLDGTVFCCTDSVKSQQELYTYCQHKKIPYQRIGYDGTALNVSRSYPLVLEEEPPRDGYEVTPSWVVPACVAGMLGVASQCYSEITLMDDISTLCHRGTTAVPKATLEKSIVRYLKTYKDVPLDIHDALTDIDYGYCNDCERGDCSDCDRGYCPDCDREEPGSYDRGRQEGYDEGYGEGYEKGYERGYEEGYEEGYDKGKEKAYDNVEEAISDLMEGDNTRLLNLSLSREVTMAIVQWYTAYEQQQQGVEK